MPITPQITKRTASPRVGSGGRRIASQASAKTLATANRAAANSSGPSSRMPTRIIGKAEAQESTVTATAKIAAALARRAAVEGRVVMALYRRVEAIDIAIT
jgi:hypothetical protein